MTRQSPAIVIADGMLGSLVACWTLGLDRTAGLASGSFGLIAQGRSSARAKRESAVQRQVALAGLGGVIERPAVMIAERAAGENEAIIGSAAMTATLLSATIAAAERGITRVIWPVHVGGREIDVDALTDLCDRALLVSQIALLDASRVGSASSVRIETPFADFTDAQLMDLALDVDAPLHAAWWCLNEQPEPCGHCTHCMRWRQALADVDPAQALKIEVVTRQPETV